MTTGYRHPLTRRRFATLLLATALVPARAAFAESPAETYVSGIADQVMKLANNNQKGPKLKGQFAALLNRYINLKAIADYALGPYNKSMPAGRRGEFYTLVNNYAAALFNFYVEDFRGSKLEIQSSTKQGKFTVIQSAITGKGNREQVRWRLTQGGSGGYRVADVNLKGVWLTISMKDRFNKVLRSSKGDFDALFAELKDANTW
jgi:phospholipid transport system substrate-binding protein